MNSQDLKRWIKEKGDWTYRLNYPLSEDSVVFDVGGYQGWFAEEIYNKFRCTVYVFEPVKSFYDYINEKFKDNSKIHVLNYGLGGETRKVDITIKRDGTSVYLKGSETESIKVVNIIEAMKDLEIEKIDLLKLNIEGEEFPLLENLIENSELYRFSDIQVQFHSFMENSVERKQKIREALSESFKLEYDFEFVWEGWKQNQK